MSLVNRTHIIRLIWSAVISLGVIALLLQLVGGAGNQDQHPGLWQIITRVAPWLFLAYGICTILQAWVRSIRYRVLLRAAGVTAVPSRTHMMLVTMARNMFVDMLPSRSGELIYVALLNRGYRVPAADCFSSLALSFVFDLVALALLVAAIVLHAMMSASAPAWMWIALVFIAAISLTGLAVLLYGSTWAGRILHRFSQNRKPARWVAVLMEFIDNMITSFETVRTSGTLTQTLLLSVAVRGLKYGGIYLLFLSITRINFPELSTAGFWQVISALLGAEAAASLPFPSLMSFGAYEAGGTAVWSMLGFSAAAGALAMLAMHICSQVVDYSIGGLGLLAISIKGYPTASENNVSVGTRAPLRFKTIAAMVLGLLAIGLASGWAFLEYRSVKKLGALEAPAAGAAIATDADAARPAWSRSLRGMVVWSSNRDGNHDIFRLSLPDGSVTPLTRHPHTEYFPRISPDGTRMVFCRSQIPWVSQRNTIPWDVYMMTLADGRETLIATNANVPLWISNQEITYQYQGNEVVKKNVDTGEETRLLYPGRGGMTESINLQTPSFNPVTGETGMGMRPVRQTSALVDRDGVIRPFGNGCQVKWSPDLSYLYYVDHLPGKDNAFFKVNPATLEKELWFNHASSFHHEYFPVLSADEQYLIFGASEGGHEHDAADYEVFLWKVGTPMDDTYRITWHTGNDCWPDIWLAP